MILVAGATGSVGGRIVRNLLERGDAVRALVRPASNSAPLREAGAQVVAGDLTDPPSLQRALDGVEVVVSTASASRRRNDSLEDVDLRGNQNLIDEAARAGVRRFVFVSTMGASPENPHALFRAKGLAEQRLRQSGMEFAILEPDAFMDLWFGMMVEMPVAAGQPVTLVGEASRRHSFIAEQDVAAFATAATHHAAAENALIVIGGPEPVTFRDVVHAYETALGRPIPVRFVAPGQPIPGLPEPVWGIAAGLESYDSPVEMEETAGRFRVTLTDAGTFARQSSLAALPR